MVRVSDEMLGNNHGSDLGTVAAGIHKEPGETAVAVSGVSKRFKLYTSSNDRIAELLSFGVKKRGHDFWALRDIDFDVPAGTSLGIIGRNGSGKSTLLKLICNTMYPSYGEIRVQGRVSSLLELGIGFNPELSGRENIYLQGAILGYAKREMDERAPVIEEFADIGEFIEQPVKHYSSGMLVRLGFACAINVDPDVLIIDEALAVGDGLFQRKCYAKIEEFRARKKTMIIVSHSMDMINLYCHQAILLNEGKMIAKGRPIDVIETYQRLLYGKGADKVAFGERSFDEITNPRARFRAVEVSNTEETRKGTLLYSDAVKIKFRVEVSTLVPGLRIGFKLHSDKHQVVLHAASSDCSAVDKDLGVVGKYEVSVVIQANWLTPGRYIVEFALWSPRDGHIQHLQQGVAFDIIANNPVVESIGNEILRPILPWEISQA
jgi:ABC-type polysaccharide/polyol phosphate transport system ATPase subunit